MSNLTIEGLGKVVQSGDIERLYSDYGQYADVEMMEKATTPATDHANHINPHGKNFADILKDSFEKVNEYQVQADTAIKELVAGRNKNIHETLLTIERADTSLKLMMQVRNKILDAYKEVMRMQV